MKLFITESPLLQRNIHNREQHIFWKLTLDVTESFRFQVCEMYVRQRIEREKFENKRTFIFQER
jgi:hypothetical protein